jgi:hypothetical protein
VSQLHNEATTILIGQVLVESCDLEVEQNFLESKPRPFYYRSNRYDLSTTKHKDEWSPSRLSTVTHVPLEEREEQQTKRALERSGSICLAWNPSTLLFRCRCCWWDLSTRSAITAIYKGERVIFLLFDSRIMLMWLRKDREQQPTRLSCWIFGLGSNPRTSMITKIPPIGHIV